MCHGGMLTATQHRNMWRAGQEPQRYLSLTMTGRRRSLRGIAARAPGFYGVRPCVSRALKYHLQYRCTLRGDFLHMMSTLRVSIEFVASLAAAGSPLRLGLPSAWVAKVRVQIGGYRASRSDAGSHNQVCRYELRLTQDIRLSRIAAEWYRYIRQQGREPYTWLGQRSAGTGVGLLVFGQHLPFLGGSASGTSHQDNQDDFNHSVERRWGRSRRSLCALKRFISSSSA
jgi:hypothetical protein